MSEAKKPKDRGGREVVAAIAITAAILIIIALMAAIAYILKNPPPAATSLAEQTGDVVLPDLSGTDAMDEASMEEMISTAPAKPSEWYGMFESNGPMDRDIDFASYREKCPDVYAWIEIPGTAIDYPIAYCEDAADPFWFTHDIDGNPSEKGMIITDSLNAKDFSDPETLIYGQNPDDGTMFAQLHMFRDSEFFDSHDTVNIYVGDAELVYRIFACYIGSSDHLFAGYDFKDPADHTRFFDSISEVRDLAMNIREDVRPSYSDHAIALITHCDDEGKRLFVHAVLEEIKF